MGDWRESDFGEAVVMGDAKGGTGWECDGAFAPGEHDEALDERWAEEPARECEPGEGGEDPLKHAGKSLYASWAGEPKEEKGKGCPTPGAFDKPDVEKVGFVGKVVSLGERVGEVGEEGVGCVEEGVVLDGVDSAEEEDEREGHKGCLSNTDADGHRTRRRAEKPTGVAGSADLVLSSAHVVRLGVRRTSQPLCGFSAHLLQSR